MIISNNLKINNKNQVKKEKIEHLIKSKLILLPNYNLHKFINLTSKFKDIVKLDLGFNNIEKIPKEIKFLKKVEEIYLNDNPIDAIPIEISFCKNLKILDLENTLINELPYEFGSLKKVYLLNMKGCELNQNFEIIYNENIVFFIDYFRNQNDKLNLSWKLRKHLKSNFYENSDSKEIKLLLEAIFSNIEKFNKRCYKQISNNLSHYFPQLFEDANPLNISLEINNKTKNLFN